MSTTYEKARKNAYKNTDPYPREPQEPKDFQRKVTDLTVEEIRGLADQKAEHEKAIADYHERKAEWSRKNRELFAQLEIDLATEFDLLQHPKRQALYDYAYDKGHSSGSSEIALVYEDLVNLVK